MNFQDLLTKIRQLDEIAPAALGSMAAQAVAKKLKSNPATPASPDNPWNDAEPTKECGDMEPKSPDGDLLTGECGGSMMPMSAPKQSDSVTMNVSMNGSGAGGIKDLLDILRNIEKSGDMDAGHDDDVLFGIGKEGFDDATTTPDPQVAGIGAVTPTGDDMFSKGKEAPKVNGGGNPMREALVARLAEKYQSIKGA